MTKEEETFDYDSNETFILDDSDRESNFAEGENLQEENEMQYEKASIEVKTIDDKGKVS